jgi:hypothetical protein
MIVEVHIDPIAYEQTDVERFLARPMERRKRR